LVAVPEGVKIHWFLVRSHVIARFLLFFEIVLFLFASLEGALQRQHDVCLGMETRVVLFCLFVLFYFILFF
jgi:hypothetical protein